MIFFLLVIFQIKHFLADFPFQTPYMLGKFKGGREWIRPLAAHAYVHAFFTLLICLFYLNRPSALAFGLAALDFAVHFIVDRVKAAPSLAGRWKVLSASEFALLSTQHGPFRIDRMCSPKITSAECDALKRGNKYFWWALGVDQMAHHLTHYFIIWRLLG